MASATVAAGLFAFVASGLGWAEAAVFAAAMGYLFAMAIPAFGLGQVTTFEHCLPATLAQLWRSRLGAFLSTGAWAWATLSGLALGQWLWPHPEPLPISSVWAIAALVPVFPVVFALGNRWVVAPRFFVRITAGIAMFGVTMGAYFMVLNVASATPNWGPHLALVIGVALGALSLLVAPWACRVAGTVPRAASTTIQMQGPASTLGAVQVDPFAICLQTTAARVTRALSGRMRWYAVTLGADWKYWCMIIGWSLIMPMAAGLGESRSPSWWFWLALLAWSMPQGFEQRVRAISAHLFIDRWKAATLILVPLMVLIAAFSTIQVAHRPVSVDALEWTIDPGFAYFETIGLAPSDVHLRGHREVTAEKLLSKGGHPATHAFLADQLVRLVYRDAGLRVDPQRLIVGAAVTTAPIVQEIALAKHRLILLGTLLSTVLTTAWIAIAIPSGLHRTWRKALPVIAFVALIVVGLGIELQDCWITVTTDAPYPKVPLHWYHHLRALALEAYWPVIATLVATTAVLAWIIVRRSRHIEILAMPSTGA